MADDVVLSTGDLETLNAVPAVDIFVNVSSINDVCNTWKSRIDGLDLDAEKIAAAFKPLTGYGILVNYVTGLTTAIASLLQSVNTVISTISGSSSDHDNSENNIDTDNGNGSGYNYGNGSSGYNGSGSSVDNSGSDVNINPDDVIQSISYADYIGLSTLLYSILKNNNVDVSKLDDASTFAKVKQLLLSSKFISKELKEKLAKYSDTSLKEMIKLMAQNGTFENFTTSNVEIVKTYLTYLAKMNGKSYSDYVGSSSNKSVIYNDMYYFNNALTYIEAASKSQHMHTVLQNVLDGKDVSTMGEKNVTAIRNVINMLADSKGKSAEDFANTCTVSDLKGVIDAGYLVNDLLLGDTSNLQQVLLTLGG